MWVHPLRMSRGGRLRLEDRCAAHRNAHTRHRVQQVRGVAHGHFYAHHGVFAPLILPEWMHDAGLVVGHPHVRDAG